MADIRVPSTYKAARIEGWFDPAAMQFVAEQASQHVNCVEIGVWKGKSTACMAEFARGHIWAVDHFRGSATEQLTSHKEAVSDTNFIRHAKRNLAQWVDAGIVEFVPTSSEEAARLLAPLGLFDFIFIDGGHTTDEVVADIRAWLPLLSPTGLLAGHDANRRSVQAALDLTLYGWKHPSSYVWTYDPQTAHQRALDVTRLPAAGTLVQ